MNEENIYIRPTYVGITRASGARMCLGRYPPHVCGDHPETGTASIQLPLSAPRMWGSPAGRRRTPTHPQIRPTHVGITLGRTVRRVRFQHPPHVCGDHPVPSPLCSIRMTSAPRMWGSSELPHGGPGVGIIRPTPGGDHPRISLCPARSRPHAPRGWRSSVPQAGTANFNTSVGITRLCITPTLVQAIAPRMWGSPPSRAGRRQAEHPPRRTGPTPGPVAAGRHGSPPGRRRRTRCSAGTTGASRGSRRGRR